MRQILENGFKKLGLEVSDSQISQLEEYARLLTQWNEKINLTAITEPSEIALKHFIDCASCLTFAELSGSVIDVGTGAGFPGLVLKILKPEIKLCLLDSLQKRITFLQEVVNKLNLQNVEFIHSRAEDGGQNKALRGKFDFATARAVANLSVLSEYCLPFVKPDGSFISMKGPDAEAECDDAISAIKKLGGEIKGINKIILPESDITHSIVIIKKVRQTPPQYPRKPGKPTREPLK